MLSHQKFFASAIIFINLLFPQLYFATVAKIHFYFLPKIHNDKECVVVNNQNPRQTNKIYTS